MPVPTVFTINGVAVTNTIKDSVRIDKVGTVNFQYDSRGNTIEDDKFKYEWDAFDRIRFIENKKLDLNAYSTVQNYQSVTFVEATENVVTFEFNDDLQNALTIDTLQIDKTTTNTIVVEYKAFHSDLEWQTLTYTTVLDTVNNTTQLNFLDVDVRQVRIKEQNGLGGFSLTIANDAHFVFKNVVVPASVWQKIEYMYDASGRRVQKIVDNKKEYWYLFDGYQMIEERTYSRGDGQTALRRQVVYGTAINEPVYIFDANANENYYLLKNDQNTVMALYKAGDVSGSAPREQYEYSGYGITNVLKTDGSVKMLDLDSNPATADVKQVKSDFANPFGYQGMWRDEHTGLYHTHYRLYDPQHVRWLTPDPSGYADGQNLYRFYAGPNGVDELGLEDSDTCRRYIDEAKSTKTIVERRSARTSKGVDFANTAEYIAETNRLYNKYQSQKKAAFCQIDSYLLNASRFNGKPYDYYAEAFMLGDIEGLGSGKMGARAQNVNFINDNIDDSITAVNSYMWSANTLGATGEKLLLVAGITGICRYAGIKLLPAIWKSKIVASTLAAMYLVSSRDGASESSFISGSIATMKWVFGVGDANEVSIYNGDSPESIHVQNSPIGKQLEDIHLTNYKHQRGKNWGHIVNQDLDWNQEAWAEDALSGVNYYAFFVGGGKGWSDSYFDSNRGVVRVTYRIENYSSIESLLVRIVPGTWNVNKPQRPLSRWHQIYTWSKEYPVDK